MVVASPRPRLGTTERAGLELLAEAGIATPRWTFVAFGATVDPAALAGLDSDRVVVKVVAPAILHKTEAGGVAFAPATADDVDAAIAEMAGRLHDQAIEGFLVEELIEHDLGLGGELLVALRWTPDFGPVVVVGAGGVHAELLARDLRPGRDLAVVAGGVASTDFVATDEMDGQVMATALREATVVRLVTEPHRGRPALLAMTALVDVAQRLLALGRARMPHDLTELEVNPLAIADGRLVALDVLLRGPGDHELPPRVTRSPTVTTGIDRLLAPRSIAIVGVSSGENIGRTILRNVLLAGFDPAAVTIIKPGASEIDGCRCVPDVAAMPNVDLLIVAVSAAAAAEVVPRVIDRDAAASVIVIPGGLEETAGGAVHAARIRAALDAARTRPGGGPVINGGNCMGIRSRPGGYDTLFIPSTKLAAAGDRPAPLAIVSQSGAFAIARLSRLEGLDPKFVITVGNQLDLTIGDHLEHLAADPEVHVVGVYVEGFAPLDGLRFLRAARRIADRGGAVILYRGGRTAAGASASASHTAAIAGDAALTRELARAAGVLVAESVEAFDDLINLRTRLDGRIALGHRLGAMTNAGFECVAIGDAADGRLELATFDPATAAALEEILARGGLAGVVDVHNPLDLTPMADDATYGDVAEVMLASPSVDVGVIANVPFTTRLRTLPSEDIEAERSVAWRLIDLWHRTTKPWIVVVDAGPRYDPFARCLEAAGIPVARTADTATRTLGAILGTLSPRPGHVASGARDDGSAQCPSTWMSTTFRA